LKRELEGAGDVERGKQRIGKIKKPSRDRKKKQSPRRLWRTLKGESKMEEEKSHGRRRKQVKGGGEERHDIGIGQGTDGK